MAAAARGRLGEVVWEAALRVERGAKYRAPVDTGFLRNSIQAHRTGEVRAEVAVGAEYGAAVEFGTGVFTTDPQAPRRPFTRRTRRGRLVTVQGQRPQPYLTPAVEEERARFERECGAAVERAARDAGGRDTWRS